MAMMRTAAVNDLTLEYEERGAGEPVVLIHINLADSFAPLMDQPALGAYRLVRYHRRGYAGSTRTAGPVSIIDQAADLAGLLDNLGIQPAHIAGHSYGGLIALQLAVDRPDLVGSLVLMEPALRTRAAGPASQDLSRRMSQGLQRYGEGDPEGAVEGFLDATFAPGYRELLERVIPGAWAQAVQDADTFFSVEFPALQGWQFGETEAKPIIAPTLSLVGANSHPAFSEFEEMLRGWFPQLETVRVPNVDHMLHLKRPALVAAAMAEFLGRHPLTSAKRG
jgi:pimeloyl-ACP methyl ester carboxylesterase